MASGWSGVPPGELPVVVDKEVMPPAGQVSCPSPATPLPRLPMWHPIEIVCEVVHGEVAHVCTELELLDVWEGEGRGPSGVAHGLWSCRTKK